MSVYLLKSLPQNRPYSWLLTCDPNRKHGGLLTAIDHEGNRFYVLEHYRESVPDSEHARAYLGMLKTFNLTPGRDVGVYADPGGAGAQAIINMAEVGLFCAPVPKDAGSVKASIERIRRNAFVDPTHKHPTTGERGAPRCYFLSTLRSTWRIAGVEYNESRLLWELRQYRQKDGGKPDEPVKENDDVIDCMRYVELVRPTEPVYVDRTQELERARLDSLSRKASDEFDDLVAKVGKRAPTTEAFW